ncbi:hypothetical protein TNCV_3754431 [Trichonephila clavipes]|nr:hypothetical protein TNCV_3754431 [Trichonephila clavipes]
MVKESRHLIDNRRSLSRKNPVPRPVSKEWDNRTKEVTREGERDFCGLSKRRDEGRVVDPPLVFKKGVLGVRKRALEGENERRVLDRENLRRALKKGGPRLEWKGRKDDERRWRWRIGVI